MTNSFNLSAGAERPARETAGPPAFVILDLTPPGLDGGEARRRLANDSAAGRIPVLRLAAKGDSPVQWLLSSLDGSSLGGKALFSRVEDLFGPRSEPISRGGLQINVERREVVANGSKVELTFTEFEILRFLAERPGRVFTRPQIVKGAKGPSYPVTERSVDVQVVSLRKKLGRASGNIETVRGVGYKFRITSNESELR